MTFRLVEADQIPILEGGSTEGLESVPSLAEAEPVHSGFKARVDNVEINVPNACTKR